MEFKGFLTAVFMLAVFCLSFFWGIIEFGFWLFYDDAIRTEKPIKPEIEITVKKNVIDTIYVYRK